MVSMTSKYPTVLCALAFHVLSKASVIGFTESNQKDNKKEWTPSSNRTKVEICEKITKIVDLHCAFKAAR